MYKIKTLNNIAREGLGLFDKSKYIVTDDVDDPDAILVRSAVIHKNEIPKSVKAIARAGAGVNNIPVEECSIRGIPVFNTPGANANAVKELAIAALLISSRDIAGGIDWVKQLPEGIDLTREVEKNKKTFTGPEIYGKTLGVFGLGAIGTMVANAAKGLGMEVLGYDPYITVDSAWMLSRSIRRASDSKEVFEKADYITLHLPSTKETAGFINKKTISQMKDNVRIINLSRPDIIESKDIAKALENGKAACYVTDFPVPEVLKMKNTIAIPHLGASTPESQINCSVMAANELIDYLENGNVTNSVNYPDVFNPKGGDESICVTHKNVPKILAQISSALSEQGLNIENLSSRSKNELGYSVFEISGKCPSKTVEELIEIDGITRVNVIKNR